MMFLVTRAKHCKIVPERVADNFFIKASQLGWRTKEPSRINREIPSLFKQLAYRAVSENEISMQRCAELLQIPYNEVVTYLM